MKFSAKYVPILTTLSDIRSWVALAATSHPVEAHSKSTKEIKGQSCTGRERLEEGAPDSLGVVSVLGEHGAPILIGCLGFTLHPSSTGALPREESGFAPSPQGPRLTSGWWLSPVHLAGLMGLESAPGVGIHIHWLPEWTRTWDRFGGISSTVCTQLWIWRLWMDLHETIPQEVHTTFWVCSVFGKGVLHATRISKWPPIPKMLRATWFEQGANAAHRAGSPNAAWGSEPCLPAQPLFLLWPSPSRTLPCHHHLHKCHAVSH